MLFSDKYLLNERMTEAEVIQTKDEGGLVVRS